MSGFPSLPAGEPASRRVILPDPAATQALGEFLGRQLQAGQALGLCGELGSGKTCLARGLGLGLGLEDPGAVCSPTYLLLVEHPGLLALLHVDAYWPQKVRAFLQDGGLDYLLELLGDKAVLAVEWADRVPELLPESTLWVHLAPCRLGQDWGREAILEDRTRSIDRSGRSGRPTSPGGQFAWLEDLPEKMQAD